MYSKLLSAHRVAQLGVPTAILPGCEPDVILACSRVKPSAHGCGPNSARFPAVNTGWRIRPIRRGTLYLDAGAADAVRNHGKSLLPGGIAEVHGSFEAGALVRLVYDRETVGVGLSNYNAADLLRIRGLKRHEVAAILGDAHYPEVVHRDNLLLDAALAYKKRKRPFSDGVIAFLRSDHVHRNRRCGLHRERHDLAAQRSGHRRYSGCGQSGFQREMA